MNYRTATLQATKALGQSATTLIDINLVDPISALMFNCSLTLLTGSRIAPAPEIFSKIELIDGSDVLLSLSGTELDALHFFERGKVSVDFVENNISTTNYFNLMVLFGRKLWDTELAFDPKKFTNPQLRITHDCTLAQTLASALSVEIWAECFDEKTISPSGFLMNKELYSFTPVTTSYEYIDLPIDYPYRKLMVQAKSWSNPLEYMLGELKLSEDNDKKVPFDIYAHDLVTLNAYQFGEIAQYLKGVGNSTYYFFGAPGYSARVVGNVITTLEYIALSANEGCRAAFHTTTATSEVQGKWTGLAPYQCVVYPFGDQMDIADWYNVKGKVGSLQLRLKGGSAVPSPATTSVVLQQLRSY